MQLIFVLWPVSRRSGFRQEIFERDFLPWFYFLKHTIWASYKQYNTDSRTYSSTKVEIRMSMFSQLLHRRRMFYPCVPPLFDNDKKYCYPSVMRIIIFRKLYFYQRCKKIKSFIIFFFLIALLTVDCLAITYRFPCAGGWPAVDAGARGWRYLLL